MTLEQIDITSKILEKGHDAYIKKNFRAKESAYA